MQLESYINESYIKQNYWLNVFLGIIPDSMISIGIAYFTESGIQGFLFSMIGLQCIYFLIWLKNTIWQWLFFKYRGKELMIKHIESVLKASNFPAPDEHATSVGCYLNNIVENNDLETNIRIKAAADIGAMSYPVAYLRMHESLRLNMAYEEALKNYKKHLENKSSKFNDAFNNEETQDIEREKINSNDWNLAMRFCNTYLARNLYEATSANYNDALAFSTAIIVTYFRPFTSNYDRYKNSKRANKLYTSVLTEPEKTIHDQIKGLRNELFAHSDASAHDVLVAITDSGGLITQSTIPQRALKKEEVECLLVNLQKFNELNEKISKDNSAKYLTKRIKTAKESI